MELYRLLLRLYPRRFRELFEDEMVELLVDRLRASRRRNGAAGVAIIWCRTIADLFLSAIQERRAVRPTRARTKPRGDTLTQDIKQALRSLIGRPAIATAVILTLAIGIGANTAMFSIVDTVLFGSFGSEAPDRLVVISNRYGTSQTSSSPPDYVDRRDQTEQLSAIAAFTPREMSLAGRGRPEQVRVTSVTASFFDVMRIRGEMPPIRFPHEESTDEIRQVVVSHALWQRRFGGALDPTGDAIRLDGESYRIAGVLPKRFDFPADTDLWIPLTFTPDQLSDDNRGNENLSVVGRMQAHASLDTVRAEMEVIAARVIETVPERAAFLERNEWGASVTPFAEAQVGELRAQLLLLWIAVAMVLAIVCANVSGVLLASSENRARELSVRIALGASRMRLTRQLFAESLLLATAGGLAAISVAAAALATLPLWVPRDLPQLDNVALDARAIGFTFGVTLITVLAFGVLPAWRGSNLTKGRRSLRLRHGLVIGEIAAAVVLLVGTGAVLESFRELARADAGFRAEDRMRFNVTLPRTTYPDPESRLQFTQEMLRRIRALPQVSTAAASYRLPLDGRTWTATFYPEGYEPEPGRPAPSADFNVTSPAYLEALGIPLLEGRDFADADVDVDAKVLLVDESLADAFWPNGGAVGGRINFRGEDSPPDYRQVVGVVGHVRNDSLDEAGKMQLYIPLAQAPTRSVSFTLETAPGRGVSSGLVDSLRAEVAELDPDLPIYAVGPLESLAAGAVALPRFHLRMLSGFAVMALVLSGLGIYSVLSTAVTARTSEFGLRMALGARRLTVMRLVLAQALGLAAIGLVTGGTLAFAASRLLAAQLLEVQTIGAPTITVMAGILLAVALVAATVPAGRAVRLDPVRALRADADG